VRIALGAKWAHEAHTGVGIYTSQLATGLAATPGVNLTLVDRAGAPRFKGVAHELERYRALPGPLWIVSQNNAFTKISGRADLVHEPFIGVGKALPVPSIVTIHDLIPLDFPDGAPSAFRFYFRNVMPRVIDQAAAVLVDSKQTETDVARHFAGARGKTHVVTLGADRLLNHVRSGTPAKRENGRSGPPYFLAVGTGAMKNIALTLEAFSRVFEESRGDVRLTVVGRPPREAAEWMNRSPQARGCVQFVTAIGETELAHLYASAVATVHPALYEGFGLVPLESMRLGTPALVSGKGAVSEVCGDAAITVDVRDPQPLADAMLNLLEDGALDRRIARGIERASRFTWQSCVENTVRVYEDVLGLSGRANAPRAAGRRVASTA
jgi:glycosyltransferase involved in cell wall biosynthesis